MKMVLFGYVCVWMKEEMKFFLNKQSNRKQFLTANKHKLTSNNGNTC